MASDGYQRRPGCRGGRRRGGAPLSVPDATMDDVPLYRDDAVVLRVHKLGEADRIVTLLTRRHGRVRAVGKGVRRTTSRFGARLEPGSHIDVQFHSRHNPDEPIAGNRGLDLVTQTESLGAYGAQLASDYGRWTVVSVDLRDGRAAHRGGRAVAARLPAGRRRAQGAGRPRARPGAHPRCVPDPGDVRLGLGAGPRGLREVRSGPVRMSPSTSRPAAWCATTAAPRGRPGRSGRRSS